MKKELNKNLTYKKTMLILAALCICSGLLALLISEVAIPLVASLLAAICLYEEKGSRSYSIITSIAIVAINALMFFIPGFIPSFWSLASIAIAFIMCQAYLSNTEKAEASAVMTVIVSVLVLFSACLIPLMAAKSFDFKLIGQFYGNIVETLRAELVSGWELLVSQLPQENVNEFISVDDIVMIFNHHINMTVSYIVIFSLFIVGGAFKLFTFIVVKCSENPNEIFKWRFKTSNVFAYFYIILSLVTVFVVDLNGLLGITAYNLYNIFMFVYFYIGFNFAVAFLSKGRRPKLAFLLVLLLVIVFFTYALQLLAIMGAFYTIRNNNAAPQSS